MRHQESARLSAYARKLRWSLSTLPEADREDIVSEMRSHVLDRIDAGVSIDDIFHGFGSPEQYARSFHDDFELSRALGSRSLVRMMRVLAYRVSRSAAAFFALLAMGCLGLFGAGVTVTALMRFIDPVHWGLWLSSHSLVFGYAGSPGGSRELLGAWIYPFAVLCLIGCWMVGQATLLWALKKIARR